MNLIQSAITPLAITLLSFPQPHPINATNLFVLGLLLFSNVCLFFQILNKQCNLDLGRGWGQFLRSWLHLRFPISCHCCGSQWYTVQRVTSWRTGLLTPKWPPKHTASLPNNPDGCLFLSVLTVNLSALTWTPTQPLTENCLILWSDWIHPYPCDDMSCAPPEANLLSILSGSFRSHSLPTGPSHTMPTTSPSHQRLHTFRSL